MRKIKKATLAVALVGLLAMPALANQFQEAEEAAGRGEYVRAVELWRPLAEAGDTRAQTYLGLMYDNGWGVPQDQAAAAGWFQRAAAAGNAEAQYHLAFAYHQGRGVQRSQVEALKWYRAAAGKGDAAAQYNLGKMYAHGLVVPRDLVEAYMWLDLAAAKPSRMAVLAARDRDILAARLSPDELKLAEERAKNWRPG